MTALIKVITDSTADLTPDLARRFDLDVVPLYVRFGEEIYRDGVDFTPASFLAKLTASKEFPKTAQPTPGDFTAVFRRWLDQGYDVLYVGLSSDLSGTFASAEMARAQTEPSRIELVDSRNLSMGIGLLAARGANLVRQGQPLARIAATLRADAPRLRTAFIVDTLEYLHKGGRLNAFQAALGALLNIHPLVAVEDGRLVSPEKVRGHRERALDRLFAYCLPRPDRVVPDLIAVTHCGCPDDAERLAARIREAIRGAEVVVTEAGAVIGSHCGPNTVGILYLEKP